MSYIKCVAGVIVVYKHMSEKCHLMDKIKRIAFFKIYNNSIFIYATNQFLSKIATYINIKEIIELLL